MMLAAMMIVWTAGCSPQSGDGALPSKNAPEEQTLTIGLQTGLETFDFQNTNSNYNAAILVNMFDSLFYKNEKGEVLPKLVDTYEQKNDVTWHFALKHGIKFHNGDDLTAKDVKFSVERVAKDPKLSQYSNFKQITEVKILDDYSFDIVTDGPDPILLNQLSSQAVSIFPKQYIDQVTFDGFLKNPVGSGLYQLLENIKDDRLVLKKFDAYFDQTDTVWDKVVFRKIPETSTRVGELLTGGIDMAELIPPAEWDRISNNKGTALLESDSTRVMSWMIRTTPGTPTADLRVRQAID